MTVERALEDSKINREISGIGKRKADNKEGKSKEKRQVKYEKKVFMKKKYTSAEKLGETLEQMSERANAHLQALVYAQKSHVKRLITVRAAKMLSFNH